ncbi:SET domain-containing protein [Delitschia confertaspora ATCC 74209]|uniref:SET domain-containing protein n=1 Tax=Delitschia confertaspora ATCC 74209 TaxID=1513339 RepID=A0A9P4MR26_9PLEO|nr:SET domain-containing protein [Delitschia confertaspora ATCC 74209]
MCDPSYHTAKGIRPTNIPLKHLYIAPSPVCNNVQNKGVGDGLFASRGFEAGTEISSLERPLIAALSQHCYDDTCANCLMRTMDDVYISDGEQKKVAACTGCRYFRYCSKTCQKDAWRRIHKLECKRLAGAGRMFGPAMVATMEVLLLRRFGLMSDDTWEAVLRLESHFEDMRTGMKSDEMRRLGRNETDFEDMLGKIAGHTMLLSDVYGTFSKEFVENMYSRITTNALTLITPTFDPIGTLFDPFLAHLNHSCSPNAYIVLDGPRVSLRALKPIAKDSELFISYIDTTFPYSRRQAELKAHWFFSCACSKCQQGPALTEDKFLIAPKDMTSKVKETADLIIKNERFAQFPANYVGQSRDEKRVAAVQGKAFHIYDATCQADIAYQGCTETIEDGVRWCKQSGLFPVHRQPYAALRDELIVEKLSQGAFHTAFQHCTKRYRYISPILYPIPWHPVRVVQTFTMAKLANYLSSEASLLSPEADPVSVEMANQGINISIIAWMLMKEVSEVVGKSHGEESRFARTVKREYDSMMVAIRSEPYGEEMCYQMVPEQREGLAKMADWLEY